MADKPIPTPDKLRQLLRYEPETGRLFWRPRDVSWFSDGKSSAESVCYRWNTRYADREAFTSTTAQGYRQGRVLGHGLVAHRVIWAIAYGHWPISMIDHLNGNRIDNRLENLRVVSYAGNSRNSGIRSDNTSGRTGVHWNVTQRKWEAYISGDSGKIRLGKFASRDSAVAARAAAEHDFGYIISRRRSRRT